MSDPTAFADFVRRVCAGDEQAAEELVRHYERAIRVAVRMRLTDPALRRQFYTVDVCQSVLRSFLGGRPLFSSTWTTRQFEVEDALACRTRGPAERRSDSVSESG